MKSLQFLKPLFILFIGTALLTSCSSDENETPNPLQQNTPDLMLFEQSIELPSALVNETDMHAQQLVGRVNSLKAFSVYQFFTIVPPGAEVSHTPIAPGTSAHRHTTMATTDYTVYTYTYENETIAYQYSTQNGMEVIEIFVDDGTTNGFIKLMEIQQTPDGTQGTLTFYDSNDGVDIYWTWQIFPDDHVKITFNNGTSTMNMEMNYYPDMSGDLKIFEDNALTLEWTWNSDGSGTWVNHGSNESGSW